MFSVWPYRITFQAVDRVVFPPNAANTLRGAFGTALRKAACVADCPGAELCDRARSCLYAISFEPTSEGGPSGIRDSPRPFLLRASVLDGRTLKLGEEFSFDLLLFQLPEETLPSFVWAFEEFAETGVGLGRGRARLRGVDDLGPRAFDLLQPSEKVSRIRVRFRTPTELKAGREMVEKPEFGVLFRRLRDRISNLRALYQGGPLQTDFREMGERADGIRMERCDVRHINAKRHSSRTGQTHPIGGFLGEAEYEGELTEFVPYLRVGEWTGVGRQTVWGKGRIEVFQT